MLRFVLALVLCACAPLTAVAQPAGAEEIVIEEVSFGLGGVARPEGWVPIRLAVTDRAISPREVMIRIALTDADGDHPTYTRVITTNPGVTQGVWMYVRLPAHAAGDPLEVIATEALGLETGEYRPGRILGRTFIPARVIPAATGLIGVLGSRWMGLNQYSVSYQQQPHPPGMHEPVLVIKDLTPENLPDRWIGLQPLAALIWAEGDPIALSSERAAALREWIARGGHLVIVLPRVGQTWLTQRNPIADLVPSVQMTRIDGVDLEPFRPLVSDRPGATIPLPDNATIHVLTPREGAAPTDAMPILTGPDGHPVVMRRLVGLGAVTLVGVDVNDPALARIAAIDPDVFWHRVLGRRGDLLTQAEVTRMATTPGTDRLTIPARSSVSLDAGFEADIAKTGRAAQGVLLGLVVFVLFWVVAAPGAYALLKYKGQVKHSWIAYAAATGVFTILAWGGASLIRPSQVDATYLRFVDHVYGENVQRSRIWASILIPSYGESTIAVGEGERFENVITPWRSPSSGTPIGGFPDARDYPLFLNDLSEMTVPTRATVKQVMADWAGPPAWRMPLPVAPEGADRGTLRLLTPEERAAAMVEDGHSRPVLTGTLVHDLPAALEDVLIIVVEAQRDLLPPRAVGSRLPGGQLLAEARAYSLSSPWAPGEPLDLTDATSVVVQMGGQIVDTSADAYLRDIVPRPNATGLAPRPLDVDIVDRLNALALYPMLEPPDPATREPRAALILARQHTHAWDLGRWFTQPAVIIIGHIPQIHDDASAPTPAPLFVDGERAPLHGRTVVRWVYPLTPAPPDYPVAPLQPGG